MLIGVRNADSIEIDNALANRGGIYKMQSGMTQLKEKNMII